MIARDSSGPPSVDPRNASDIRRWWDWWELALSRGLGAVTNAAAVAVDTMRRVASLCRRIARFEDVEDLRRPALAVVGVSAITFGAVVGVLVASPGVDRRAAALAGAASFMWIAVRWLCVRVFAPALATDRAVLRGALSLGLLGYAFAATPELRFVAWLLAGVISAYVLVRFGSNRADVARGIGSAWGVQAAVVVGGWLAGNAFVAYFASHG